MHDHQIESISRSKRLRLLTLIADMNKKILTGWDHLTILNFIFDHLHQVIPYDRISIGLLEERGEQTHLTIAWVRANQTPHYITDGYRYPIEQTGIVDVLKSNRPRIIGDFAEYVRLHPESEPAQLLFKEGINSNLTCPMRTDASPTGIVFFSSRQPHAYTDEHVDVFLEIADQMSFLVQHMRLRNSFKTYLQQAQNMNHLVHDLKSPLNVILGFAQAARNEAWFKTLDPEGQNVFTIFLRNSQYMLGLLDEVLELHRLEAKGDELKLQSILLKDFCEDMCKFATELGRQKGIEVISELSEILPASALFDPTKIRRILENLLSNAVKFSRSPSQVKFSAHIEESYIVFRVSDQGIGIPRGEQGKLFQEFGRTSACPTAGETSSGLGLAIVKKLADLHHGKVSIESESGKGSTVTFSLPLLQH